MAYSTTQQQQQQQQQSSSSSSSSSPEPLNLTPAQQAAYNAAYDCLNNDDGRHSADDFGGCLQQAPTIVRIAPLAYFCRQHDTTTTTTTTDGSSSRILAAPSSPAISVASLVHGPQELARQLERLEAMSDLAATVTRLEEEHFERALVTRQLMEIVTGSSSSNSNSSSEDDDNEMMEHSSQPSPLTTFLHQLADSTSVPRRQVCQHPFKRNDIVWVCRTCQADETCVLCHDCFSQSNHEGHDVAFYHAQAGGCCDCGDADAWDPAGFCPHHGPPRDDDTSSSGSNNHHQSNSVLTPELMERIQGVVPAAVDWMVHNVVQHAQQAYARAHPRRRRRQKKVRGAATDRRVSSDNSVVGGEGGDAVDDDETTISSESLSHRPMVQQSHSMPDYYLSQDDDDFGSESDDDVDMLDAEPAAVASQAQHGPLEFSPAAASAARHQRQVIASEAGISRRAVDVDEMDEETDDAAVLLARLSDPNRRLVPVAAAVVDTPSLRIGKVGAQGGGLYIVLFADDIHSTHDMLLALKEFFWGSGTRERASLLAGVLLEDSLLTKMVRALRYHGHLVVWGPVEFSAECGMTQVQLWMDGDNLASTRIGAIALERASRFTKQGIHCSVVTFDELMAEQRALHILQWLSVLAKSCDPLCKTLAESILPNRHLVPLLQSDFKVNARVTKRWYSLLLTLLAVPAFKSHLAAAYCDTYQYVTAKYARGMGVLERSGYTLSVQFLNRVAYVVDLVQNRDLFGILGKSILQTLLVASQSHLHGRLDPQHPVLSHRRYSPCISDLKCVLNVKGMPRIFACEHATFLTDWISTLSAAQFMDPHAWRHSSQGHVELESRGWVSAFNLSISLGSLFERLLGWQDDEISPITNPASPYSSGALTCVDATFHVIVKGIMLWQRSETVNYRPVSCSPVSEPHKRSTTLLPFATVAFNHGTRLAFEQIPMSQVTEFSFHLPLYRFVSSCLRELCLRCNDTSSGVTALKRLLDVRLPAEARKSLYLGLMGFPMLVMSRAAQIRAGLWRKNGQSMNDQVLNYAEPPFCRTMRDADLLLIQFAVLGMEGFGSTDAAVSTFVHLLLHRLGLFEFVGMTEAPDQHIDRYMDELVKGEYPKMSRGDETEVAEEQEHRSLPFTYSASRETATSVGLLEEFLHTVVIFCSELPLVAPSDQVGHTRQAQWKLHREIIHRLASGPKTHSELTEVQHVLSYSDNTLLNDQGKEINPDDASGAALNMVLTDVAQRKASRDRMEPDKWELHRDSWEYYDPAFFHISLRSHQTAAENRPKPVFDEQSSFGWKVKPYAPSPEDAHPFFRRLRRDISADSTVLAVVYRVLHLHCRQSVKKDLSGVRGHIAYEHMDPSETALARAVNFLTLGAYAWAGADLFDPEWRYQGGGSPGSIFHAHTDRESSPTAEDWVIKALLVSPVELMDSEWYEGEENALLLLRRLAVDGGSPGAFVAQDSSVRAGAAWLCNFAVSVSADALALLGPSHKVLSTLSKAQNNEETELDRRRRLAKERALARMKVQAAKFSSMMDIEMMEDEDVFVQPSAVVNEQNTPSISMQSESGDSILSSSSKVMSISFADPGAPMLPSEVGSPDDSYIPCRLLSARPRCIICNDEDAHDVRMQTDDTLEGHRKRSRHRTENALAFIAYAQASTVLRGGGGPPPALSSSQSAAAGFVGTHVALCGHCVHSDCCESYLSSVSHRDDRTVGKRDEFRCPLCQRLSNCLVPFIDVGVDWINLQTSSADVGSLEDDAMQTENPTTILTLDYFLDVTPWWVRSDEVIWDGHSAFMERIHDDLMGENEKTTSRDRRPLRIRSLKKNDLYAAWNTMMRTPRFVRRKLRPRPVTASVDEVACGQEQSLAEGERENSGETVVWRRLIDQLSDLSYRADSKRLGDDQLHALFGEFRHYIAEKYAYNLIMADRFGITSPVDWPSCLFSNRPIADTQRQELSREKLISKLMITIQALTYSSCCEQSEAKRLLRKATTDVDRAAVESKFGVHDVICDGILLRMYNPSVDDNNDGLQPFSGRLGKLRYIGLATMAAAGAIAPDLVQLALSFPTAILSDHASGPLRCPIVYPLLLCNVLTHVSAAISAVCGRARAGSDGVDLVFTIPQSACPLAGKVKSNTLFADCENIVKLGLLARMLQTLLAGLQLPSIGVDNPPALIAQVKRICTRLGDVCQPQEMAWILLCARLVSVSIADQSGGQMSKMSSMSALVTEGALREACALAYSAVCSFLGDIGIVLQIFVPGFFSDDTSEDCDLSTLDKLRVRFRMEPLEQMVESASVQCVVSYWYEVACVHSRRVFGSPAPSGDDQRRALSRCLFRTQGYRSCDWPFAGLNDASDISTEDAKRNEVPLVDSGFQIQHMASPQRSRTDLIRTGIHSSKKTIPLLGGYSPLRNPLWSESSICRVSVMPISYTDLYAELGSLLPNCEQIAVCLICGKVMSAGGKGECTKHSYQCGAGAGLFFLLQECSGLVMHKSKASYIHSPYVDSHGETPQFRGRPLNLDLVRYEHLRELWTGHGIRQMVVAERSNNRQVILNDYY